MTNDVEIKRALTNANVLERLIAKIGGHRLDINLFLDELADSPRTFDNLAHMVCYSKRYILGDPHNFETPQDFVDWSTSEQNAPYLVVKDLYLYDHSGLRLSTAPFDDPWDSGQLGWVYVDLRETSRRCKNKEYSELSEDEKEELRKQAEEIIEAEVVIYDKYLYGDVYAYCIDVYHVTPDGYEKRLDDLCDSCGGFYGLRYFREIVRDTVTQILQGMLNCSKEKAEDLYELILAESEVL